MDELRIKLSERERQCLYFAAHDFTMQETAEKMHLSFQTVKTYRRIVLQKLDCKTIGGAVCRAWQLNIFAGE